MKKLIYLITTLFLITACNEFDNFFDPTHVEPKTTASDNDDNFKDMPLDFESVTRVVLQENCTNCHSGRHAAYDNYNVVRASAAQMLERMTTTNPSLVMPLGRQRLSPDVIAFFEKWINAGMPEEAEVKDDDDDDDKKPEPTETQIGFEQIKKQVLEPNNCISCHAQYNDYASVRKSIGGILALSTSGAMPFPVKKGATTTPVPKEGLDLLNKWLDQGTPEFAFAEPQALPDVELEPNWISLRNNVFGPKCILCHNDYGNRGGGLSFNTYTKLQAAFKKTPALFNTDPEVEEFGDLHTTLIGDPEDPFAFPTPMPYNTDFDDVQKNVERITPDELKVIEEWIKSDLPFGAN